MFRAILYAYVIGGLTFIPILIVAAISYAIYTSVPVGDPDVAKRTRGELEASSNTEDQEDHNTRQISEETQTNDIPRTRKGWLTMRRTFEESAGDGGYVTLVRSFLDSRSKDPKRSRPKDMWYVALKGKVLYLYEDESMSECEAAVELSGHKVFIYPENLPDGELFAKRNAICLMPRNSSSNSMPSLTKQMNMGNQMVDEKLDASSATGKSGDAQRDALLEVEKKMDDARKQALDPSTPWFIFVRSNVKMEDWYFALIHASEQPSQTPTLEPLSAIFDPSDMNYLLSTLDDQPDVIPMRWLNALLGRIFFSHYRTRNLEAFIVGRLMKKLSKVKRPGFLTEIVVTEVSVGNRAPMLSKPMLKELTKEGDASIEVHLQYKGEVRITVEATAVINLGARFKSYTVKLVLAAVLKELEGNLLIKVKRPPSNRIWYAFTQTPRMVMEVEPIVSDRQITWGMVLKTIESQFKDIIQESIVMPNMDDIAFFETSGYVHRGGIYSDACRKPHVSTTIPQEQEYAQSTTSAPVLDSNFAAAGETALPIPPELNPAAEIEPVERSSSAPVEIPTITRSSAEDSEPSSKSARRRSWFSSIRSDDASVLSEPNDTEESRGRTLEPDRQSPSPRSQSTPKPASVRSTSSEKSDTVPLQLAPQSLHRYSASVGGNQLENEDAVEPRAKSTPTTPRKNSDASHIARSASPPSFFSTLKSKAAAADKEALSKTAKEAMRKWGVNWGGFKKDASNPSSGDEGSQVANSPPRPTLTENAATLAQKARASYAEVRAAVAERKERERVQQDDSSSNTSGSTSLFTSTPRERVLGNPNSTLSSNSIYSEGAHNPSIITSSARLSTPKLTSKKSSPSISRVNTDADASNLPDSLVVEPVKHMPIHVQPQAKTMSIPGIHASHRGDVQAMGYVAPIPIAQPSTSQSSSSSNTGEAMLKNPALQKVYSLWKNPSHQGQGTTHGDGTPSLSTPEETEETEQSQTTISSDETEADDLSTPLSSYNNNASSHSPLPLTLPPPQQVLVKPAPPPLPPRSASALRPVMIVSSDSPGPSASETLKNIVEKDDGYRAATVDIPSSYNGDVTDGPAADVGHKLTEVHPAGTESTSSKPTPPALPPRRIPASAS